MMRAKLHERNCKWCGDPFEQKSALQSLCSPKCAIDKAKHPKNRKTPADRKRLQAMKPLRQLLAELQTAFNAFIRERDKDLPCISCGRMHKGSWDAGHYMSTGARPGFRFDEANCHRQCVPCNQHLSGNIAAYRVGLIARIGLAEVERLEGPCPPHKWTREEATTTAKTYRAKTRELKASHG